MADLHINSSLLAQTKRLDKAEQGGNADLSQIDGVISSAYIHIPFCRRRCYYCDFPIAVVGDRPPLQRSQGVSASASGHGSGAIADYIQVLCKEIQATPSHCSPQGLATVFFGGGTPSLLGVEQLESILQTLDQQFGISRDAECAMEMDPGTFTLDQIHGYAALGVNRVSLGTQSFDDRILEACGRVHRVADIHRAIEQIHQVGIQNWSLDLISGLPHLTMKEWERSLQQAITLNPTHISVYDLTIEANTAFGKWYAPGESPLPTDEMTADMYRMAQQMLTDAGYHHYEISNYAKPGYECRHNQVYWQNQPYYGFGMGAASYVNNQRFSRPRTRQAYADWVHRWAPTGAASLDYDCEPTSPQEQLLDTLMLGLRLATGIYLEPLVKRFGTTAIASVLDTFTTFQNDGWIEIILPSTIESKCSLTPVKSLSQGHIRLTDPEGFLFSNVVLSTLFERLESLNLPDEQGH